MSASPSCPSSRSSHRASRSRWERRTELVRAGAIEVARVELDGALEHLHLVNASSLTVALAPLEVWWRGTRRSLAPSELHASRAGELSVFRPVGARVSLIVASFAPESQADSERSRADLLAHLAAPDDPARSAALERLLEAVASVDHEQLARSQPHALELRPVRRARLHLEAHHADAPTLAELAALSDVSRFHLARAFRAYHGVPPHEYLNCIRIAHARELLARQVPAVVVAGQLGFVDQSHLTHRFHEIVGLAPSHYARASTPARD